MGTICPFCNIESDEASIEMEDGCCPECGSVITVPSLENDDDIAVFEEDEELFDNIEFDEEEDDEF